LLVSLWVFATLEGISSAREVARLCENHIAYRWLCGGVSVNHHLLSDFRTENAAAWSELLSQSLVNWVAEQCGLPDELGKKVSSILKSRATRKEFLSDTRHRIRFVCLPKHSSWLNQIEIIFGIIHRKSD
jgi:hypothetical protein